MSLLAGAHIVPFRSAAWRCHRCCLGAHVNSVKAKLRLRSCAHALCMHAGHATVRQDCAALRGGCGRWSGPGGPGFLLGEGFA